MSVPLCPFRPTALRQNSELDAEITGVGCAVHKTKNASLYIQFVERCAQNS